MAYCLNGFLRVEFRFEGYDCEVELDRNGITTVDIDSIGCFEFDSEMCTLHHLTNFVRAVIRQSS